MCEAVDNNLVSDTASRNALYKIQVSLGKIVNSLDAAAAAAEAGASGTKYRRSVSRASSLGPSGPPAAVSRSSEDRTIVQTDVKIKEEEMEDEDMASDTGTVVHRSNDQSLVSDVLSEDGEGKRGGRADDDEEEEEEEEEEEL